MPDKKRTANKELREYVYVDRSPIHGKGVFAKKRLRKGQYVGTYHGPLVKKNGTYVLWVDEGNDKWIRRDGKNLLRYLNHSTKPNTEFDGFDLYAMKNISPDKELTFDYGEEPA